MISRQPVLMKEERIPQNEIVPGWLDSFLQRNFFGPCFDHELQRNEMNRYCITCNVAACKYCLLSSHHDEHKVLKIYRHVYKDVVPLHEMENHMDCSKIQPYKCNKKWVIALNPLPHCGSGAQIGGDSSCEVCKRRLNDPDQYRFCCIACKVEAFSSKRKRLLSSEHLSMEAEVATTKEERRKHRRKGAPQRAPLF